MHLDERRDEYDIDAVQGERCPIGSNGASQLMASIIVSIIDGSGRADVVKLALERCFARPDGAKLALERRFGGPTASSWSQDDPKICSELE